VQAANSVEFQQGDFL